MQYPHWRQKSEFGSCSRPISAFYNRQDSLWIKKTRISPSVETRTQNAPPPFPLVSFLNEPPSIPLVTFLNECVLTGLQNMLSDSPKHRL